MEDARNRPPLNENRGGEEYFYQLLLRQLPVHSLPVQRLISPFSPLTSVIGIDLNFPTGTAYLEEITIRFESAPGSTGKIEPSDFKDLRIDESSGVSIYRDGQGPTEGGFDFTNNEKRDDDLLIIPTEQPILRVDPVRPGVFEVTLKLYDSDIYGTNPNPLTSIPAMPDEGLYDFFIVVRTSGNLSHDESFFITIPPEGLVATNPSTQSCIPLRIKASVRMLIRQSRKRFLAK